MLGTPYYMAPELTDGKPYDYAADLWSVGVIVFEMLVGARPWQAPDPRALRLAIEFPRRVSVSERAAAFIRRLLVVDPGARFRPPSSSLIRIWSSLCAFASLVLISAVGAPASPTDFVVLPNPTYPLDWRLQATAGVDEWWLLMDHCVVAPRCAVPRAASDRYQHATSLGAALRYHARPQVAQDEWQPTAAPRWWPISAGWRYPPDVITSCGRRRGRAVARLENADVVQEFSVSVSKSSNAIIQRTAKVIQ